MARTPLFDKLRRSIRIALFAERERISTPEAIERVSDDPGMTRRGFLSAAGGLAAGAALAGTGCLSTEDELGARVASLSSSARIAIVGAGLGGLACATQLRAKGVGSTLYEAADHVGGRQYSLTDPVRFPGQVVERGGELIDTAHKTLIGWARSFGLTLENYLRNPGEVFYHFDGVRYPEAVVVDEFRALVEAMRDDLRSLGDPTAESHTDADVDLDYTSLREYLDTRGAGRVISQAVESAYVGEYGLEIDDQSCLSFLLFVHADRRSKWTPFGVFSDERYHVVEGNQRISEGLAERLPDQLRLGHTLVKVAPTSGGRIALHFKTGGKTVIESCDAAVLAIPFSTLREVDLDPGLALPEWKQRAIAELRYGTNAKMMIGFSGRPWAAQGGNGTAYATLPHHQISWETSWTTATASRAVITDYSGGARGAALRPATAQDEAERWLRDFDRIYPGAAAQVRRTAGGAIALHLEHWPSNPLARGSYTANHPGYFTTIADLEARPVGNLYFAGEHTSSFYEWQGFMEGAALSGLRAAAEILAAMKK